MMKSLSEKMIERRGIRQVKKIALVLFMTLIIGAAAYAQEKPLGVPEYTSVNELAQAMASYFPKVQGEVKSVQGSTLTIEVGTKAGLKTGINVTIWRPGKELLHPVTKEVMGRAEEEIGEVEILQVGESSSTAKVIKKTRDPKPGDLARITPKKINLALIPLRAERTEVVRELAGRLNELGRFSVLESGKVATYLKDKKERDSSLIKAMGREFGLDVVGAVELYPSEAGKLLVTVRMFYADDARQIDSIMAMLDLQSKKETLSEVKPFFAPDMGDTGFFGEGKRFTAEGKVSAKLPFEATLFAVADLEGNGTLHYIFSDGAQLHIYLQEASGWREEWSDAGTFSANGAQHINIDVADINGNGKPEIFVTAMQNDKVISYVMEFQDGAFRRISAIPGFLRVVPYPGKGMILLGQSYHPEYFYVGKPKQYTWSEGKYVAGKEFPLPKGVELYGFTVAAMGEESPFLVALNNADQLVVYSSNNAIWKSEEKFSPVGILVDKPLTGHDAVWQKEAAAQVEKTGGVPLVIKADRVRVRGRVLSLDVDGDGKEEVLVPKNGVVPYLDYVSMNYVTKFRSAEFAGLSWTGTRLEQRLSIKDVPGMVKDFQVIRQPGAGAQVFALITIPSWWWFGSDTTQVTSYIVK
jgi:hypothetical protein